MTVNESGNDQAVRRTRRKLRQLDNEDIHFARMSRWQVPQYHIKSEDKERTCILW